MNYTQPQPMREPEYVVLKLVSSEEVLCVVHSRNADKLVVEYPVRAALVGPGSVQFIPFISTSDSARISIANSAIMCQAQIDAETLESYKQMIASMSGIPNVIVPDSKIIL